MVFSLQPSTNRPDTFLPHKLRSTSLRQFRSLPAKTICGTNASGQKSFRSSNGKENHTNGKENPLTASSQSHYLEDGVSNPTHSETQTSLSAETSSIQETQENQGNSRTRRRVHLGQAWGFMKPSQNCPALPSGAVTRLSLHPTPPQSLTQTSPDSSNQSQPFHPHYPRTEDSFQRTSPAEHSSSNSPLLDGIDLENVRRRHASFCGSEGGNIEGPGWLGGLWGGVQGRGAPVSAGSTCRRMCALAGCSVALIAATGLFPHRAAYAAAPGSDDTSSSTSASNNTSTTSNPSTSSNPEPRRSISMSAESAADLMAGLGGGSPGPGSPSGNVDGDVEGEAGFADTSRDGKKDPRYSTPYRRMLSRNEASFNNFTDVSSTPKHTNTLSDTLRDTSPLNTRWEDSMLSTGNRSSKPMVRRHSSSFGNDLSDANSAPASSASVPSSLPRSNSASSLPRFDDPEEEKIKPISGFTSRIHSPSSSSTSFSTSSSDPFRPSSSSSSSSTSSIKINPSPLSSDSNTSVENNSVSALKPTSNTLSVKTSSSPPRENGIPERPSGETSVKNPKDRVKRSESGDSGSPSRRRRSSVAVPTEKEDPNNAAAAPAGSTSTSTTTTPRARRTSVVKPGDVKAAQAENPDLHQAMSKISAANKTKQDTLAAKDKDKASKAVKPKEGAPGGAKPEGEGSSSSEGSGSRGVEGGSGASAPAGGKKNGGWLGGSKEEAQKASPEERAGIPSFGGGVDTAGTGIMSSPTEAIRIATENQWNQWRYQADRIWELYPNLYILMQMGFVVVLVLVGGCMFWIVDDGLEDFGQAMWKAWCCISVLIHHTKEEKIPQRTVGFLCCMGGLTFFGLLVGTISANTRMKLEALKQGRNGQVVESKHIVVAGFNQNLPSLLRSLCYTHETKLSSGTAERPNELIVLLSSNLKSFMETECKALQLKHPSVSFVHRSADLKLKSAYEITSCAQARKIVLLAPSGKWYNNAGDARVVSNLLALQRSLMASILSQAETNHYVPHEPVNVDIVCQVSKASTAQLVMELGESMQNWIDDLEAGELPPNVEGGGLESDNRVHHSIRVQAVKNLSANLFVQCMRQEGLINVYRTLLSAKKANFIIRHMPNLKGYTWKDVRKLIPDAVVCGLVRGSSYDFFPEDNLVLQANDRLLLLTQKLKFQLNIKDLKKQKDINVGELLKKQAKPRKQRLQIVMCGWAADRTAVICDIFNRYAEPGSSIVVLSELPIADRMAITQQHQDRVEEKGESYNLQVIHKVGSPMSFTMMKKAVQSCIKASPGGAAANFSFLVVPETPQGSNTDIVDEQSVFQLLLAERAAREAGIKNAGFVGQVYGTQVSKQVHALYPQFRCLAWGELNALFTNQLMEHPELQIVWDELLSSNTGEDVFLKNPTFYTTVSDSPETITFRELEERAHLRGETAIGYYLCKYSVREAGQVFLCPSRDAKITLDPKKVKIVVISPFEN